MSPPTGFSAITDALPAEKALVARRIVASGREPTPADFDKAGLTLAPSEREALFHWVARGLSTRVVEESEAADGTVKMLLALHDGRTIESVAMPVGAACVSTQVGCAVRCRFCASGREGVERNLSSDEIVEQVVHARRRMRIDRVVFMGMGEPSHNLTNVLTAVRRLKEEVLISPRRQTLSTVGSIAAFARMAEAEVRPCLAVSLHLADEERRRELLPNAHRDRLDNLVRAADDYGRAIRMPVQFEWTLLRGINDGENDVEQLCELLAGVRGYVNFIVYNPVPDLPYEAPPRERIVEIVRAVKRHDILATIRDSSGSDAQAACGQLRLRRRADLGGTR